MKLILVEDDESCIDDFSSTVKRYVRENKIEINYEVASTVEAAEEILDSSFDGAIIDLKLHDDVDGGNKVISGIQNNYRIPIVVLTGTPSHLNEEESALLKLYLRDGGYDPVLEFLRGIFQTGLTQILGGRGLFENALNSLFWNHIPKNIEHYIESNSDSSLTQVQLLRHTISHVNELLEHSIGGDSNPAETYIYPSIRNKASEGAIIKNKESGRCFIVLTPACDISNNKADFLQIVSIREVYTMPEVTEILGAGEELSNKKKDRLKSRINTLVRNKTGRYHYLPKFGPIISESVADFQNIQSISLDCFRDDFELLGNISGSFYKDLVDRFSSNYSRQGSPDYNFNVEEALLMEKTLKIASN